MFGTSFSSICEGHVFFLSFNLFFSRLDLQTHFQSFIFACTACRAIQFGTKMYLPMSYKLYKKRACLLRIDGVAAGVGGGGWG